MRTSRVYGWAVSPRDVLLPAQRTPQPAPARDSGEARRGSREPPAAEPDAAAVASPGAHASRDDGLSQLLARSVADRSPPSRALDLTPAASGEHGPSGLLARQPAALLEPPGIEEEGPADLPPPQQRRMIRRGNTGREVSYAQERLNAHISAGLAVDAIFGPLTQAATRDYQGSHGLSADAIIGPRSWASLDGPTSVSGGAGAGKGGGAGGPGSKVLLYDTSTVTFGHPGSLTMAKVPAEVKAKQDAGKLGPTVTVKGVVSGSEAELFVWNVLLLRAAKANWGSELDTITAIGNAPAKPAGAPAPVGQVTIRIDGKGNAEGVLVAAGAPAISAKFKDEAAAIAALKKDFGFSVVRNGTGTWTLPDLTKTYAGLSRLPAADRSALKGVELIRELTLVDEKGKALSGRFSFKEGVSGTTVIDERQLLIANIAFDDDAKSFIGGAATAGPASFHTIVHEAGHAAEKKASLDAKRAESEALVSSNKAQDATNAAVATVNAEVKKAEKVFKGRPKATKTAAAAYHSAVGKAVSAINAFANDNTNADHPKTEKPAADAIAARDAQKAKVPVGNPVPGDFATASKAQDDWFASGKVRAAARAKLSATRATLKTTGGSGNTARVQAFVAFVKKEKIPPLTKYAKDNWPKHPEEFFAEAFSLWLNDPEYLKSQAPTLKTWFDTGKHRI